jgi:hypothetical protein
MVDASNIPSSIRIAYPPFRRKLFPISGLYDERPYQAID